MKDKSRKLMWILSGVLTAVFIFVIFQTHRIVPFMMDDLWYSTMLYDESVPITSISDIVKSQIWHYNNWGGRSMTHGILQLTLLIGEYGADLLNVVFTLLLAGMICIVSGYRNLPAFFAAAGMVLGLNANWKMSMFWQAGAANYLYITVFILVFVFCYLRELPEGGLYLKKGCGRERAAADLQEEGGNSQESGRYAGGRFENLPGITFWIVPLGILAGWSNENMGPAIWLVSLAAILLLGRQGRRLRLWMILGNLSCLAGSVLCIAAPGNFVRSGQIEEESYGLLWKLFLRCYAECRAAVEYLFPTLLVLAALLFVSRQVLKQALEGREILLLSGALLSWGAFVLSPHYPDRATFGTMVLCICVIVSLAKKILRRRADLAWPLWCGALLIWLRGMYFCGEWLALMWGWIRQY
mgnify:CR=1 FL=1